MKTPVSQRRLEQITKRWQRKLRLDDWRISVKWASEPEMIEFFREDADEPDPVKAGKQAIAAVDDLGPNAWNTVSTERREVSILLKSTEYETALDAERAVVHELLHIVLAWLTPGRADAAGLVHLEQAIITLEEALMGSRS